MIFEPKLEKAKLVRRYKRFLADVELDNGELLTMHCANTGAMTGCADPGNLIWYSTSDNPKRKYANSWEISVNSQGHHICINTAKANHLVMEALNIGSISELSHYTHRQAEVKYGQENSRIDLLLSEANYPDCYIEVKSVTLLSDEESNGQGYFPDAVTTRGQKHLRELIEMVNQGHRAILFFAVLHTGIEKVSPAHHIDSNYSQLLKEALAAGVEVLCYQAEISPQSMQIARPIPFQY